MSDDDVYRTATGAAAPGSWEPFAARVDTTAVENGFLDDGEMLALVVAAGGEALLPSFPMRMQPDGDHPGDKVFPLAMPLPGGGYLAVLFSFGQPSADEFDEWRPRWRAVKGPMSLDELKALGRELA